jgi:hypothetical protein
MSLPIRTRLIGITEGGQVTAETGEEEDIEMLYGPEETDFMLLFADMIRTIPAVGPDGGMEGKREKPLKPAPDTTLLAKIREAAENYDIGELNRVMKELEQYNYESNTDLILWLREQIDKSGFEKIKEWLLPREQKNILCFEVQETA